MGRSKAKINYPSIPALMGLMEWYADLNKLPKRWNVSESRYVELLSEQLVKDEILPNPSKNLIYKLLGNPPQSKLEFTDAFEEDTLEKLSKAVLKKADRLQYYSEGMYWKKIQSQFFPTPTYLQSLQSAGYFKFLTEKEQKLVSGYVKIRLSPLIKTDATFYTVFMWSTLGKEMIGGVLAFSGEFAWASGFKNILIYDENLRSDLTDGFVRTGASELAIMLFSENITSQSSMYFLIDLPVVEMPANYLIGICTYRRVNGEVGTSKVVLKKLDDYDTAKVGWQLALLEDREEITSFLTNKSIEFNGTDSYFLKRLPNITVDSSPLFPLNGSYVFGFIVEPKANYEQRRLFVGMCTILPQGSVTFRTPVGSGDGYISNYSSNLQNISIRHLESFAPDAEGANFELKVERIPTDKFAIYLDGYFTTYLYSEPIGGKVSFVQNNDPYVKDDFKEELEEREGNIIKVYNLGDDITEKYALDILERLTIPDQNLRKHSVHHPRKNI